MSYTPVRDRLRPGDAVTAHTDGLMKPREKTSTQEWTACSARRRA